MNLLSLDPSLTCTGWAVWDVRDDWRWTKKSLIDHGHYKTDPKDGSDDDRLDLLTGTMQEKMRDFYVEKVVYEKAPLVNRGRVSNNILKYRRAVDYVSQTCNLQIGRENVYGCFPTTWKGSGKKEDTILIVNDAFDLNFEYKENDIADAIGIGLWFIERQRCHPIDHIFTG